MWKTFYKSVSGITQCNRSEAKLRAQTLRTVSKCVCAAAGASLGMIDGSFPAVVESMQSVTLLRQCNHTRAGVWGFCFFCFFLLLKNMSCQFSTFFFLSASLKREAEIRSPAS